MEQLAAHPEIVAEVIAASRAGQAKATRAEVLRRIKKQGTLHDDKDKSNLKLFRRATSCPELPKITNEVLDSVVARDRALVITINNLDETIRRIKDIRERLLQKYRAASRRYQDSYPPEWLKQELADMEPQPQLVDESQYPA